MADAAAWLAEHLHDHYALYGEHVGVRSARKHIGWAVRALPGGEAFRAEMNRIDDCAAQVRAVSDWFERLGRRSRPAAAHPGAGGQRRPDRTERMTKKHIDDCVRESLEQYFKDLRGVEPHAMHEMI